MSKSDALQLYNYAVSFIDLLGQQEAYKGEALLPKFVTPEERAQFSLKVKETVGAVDKLQESYIDMFQEIVNAKPLFRESLTPEQIPVYEEMRKSEMKHQFWSDGLVMFSSLGNPNVQIPMVAIYDMFCITGALCFLGLAGKKPIRAALEVAWAVELNPGELHGAAVARAYELESKVAQWPRIIVGPILLEYLETNARAVNNTPQSLFSMKLAKLCQGMIACDLDGRFFLNYLGDTFRASVTTTHHDFLYGKALEFILAQCRRWQDEKNTKLATRYAVLHEYYLINGFNKTEDTKA